MTPTDRVLLTTPADRALLSTPTDRALLTTPTNRVILTTPADRAHLVIRTQTRGGLVFRAGTSALPNSYEKRERNGLIN